MTLNVDDVIAAYLTLRTHKEQMIDRHKLELAPINNQMNKCLLYIQQQLQSMGLTNLKGKSGIAFLQQEVTVKVEDWQTFYSWVKSNNAEMFLEHRACKSVVQEYAAANDSLPPGVNMSSSVEVRVRKS
jgi:hypothetical protein